MDPRPPLRDRVLDSETPPLTRSELVVRPWGRRGLAGSLCPNAPLGDGRRFDDVARGRFILLSSVPLSARDHATLADRGAQVLEVDPGSPLQAWLSAGHATAAIVRPDHTIMQSGRDVAGLCEAVPRFPLV